MYYFAHTQYKMSDFMFNAKFTTYTSNMYLGKKNCFNPNTVM